MRFRSLMFNLRDAKNPHFITARAMPRRWRCLPRVARADHSGMGAWQAVICGQIHTSNLATMEVCEMASEEMKKARLAGTAGTSPPRLPHIASHRYLVRKFRVASKARLDAAEHAKMALMDDRTYKNYAGKATEDGILKCPKCKSMKTDYVEVQTRSADEPTTKKCICNVCDYRWKFC